MEPGHALSTSHIEPSPNDRTGAQLLTALVTLIGWRSVWQALTSPDAAHDGALSRIARNVGYALIWLLYWRWSARVRLTFASA